MLALRRRRLGWEERNNMGAIPQSMLAQVDPALPTDGAPMDTIPLAEDGYVPQQEAPMPAMESPINMDFSTAPATKEEFDALPRWKQKAFEAAWNGAQFTQDSLQQFIISEMGKENEELRKKADPKYQAEVQKTQAESEKAAAERDATEREKLDKLKTSERSYKFITGLLDQLENHPGRKWSTGGTSILPAAPGTDAMDYKVLLDQMKGNAFMQAYAGLKGGGQITEVEGKKATEAIARLNPMQSEEGYLKALKEFRSQIDQQYNDTISTLKPKVLDRNTALQFLRDAGGDKQKARELARQAGYK